MEFNVKDIRTKLLNPTPTDHLVPIQNRNNSWLSTYSVENRNDDQNMQQSIASKCDNESLSIINNNDNGKIPLTLELFVNSLNIILYQDNETRNSIKTELISLFIDDISVAFNQQVIYICNVMYVIIPIFLFFIYSLVHLILVLVHFKLTINYIHLVILIFPLLYAHKIQPIKCKRKIIDNYHHHFH